MRKIAKSEVTPGLLCATAAYPEVLVLGIPNSRGMVKVRVVRAQPGSARAGWEVSIPWKVLRD
jgi:hypothetical protein